MVFPLKSFSSKCCFTSLGLKDWSEKTDNSLSSSSKVKASFPDMTSFNQLRLLSRISSKKVCFFDTDSKQSQLAMIFKQEITAARGFYAYFSSLYLMMSTIRQILRTQFSLSCYQICLYFSEAIYFQRKYQSIQPIKSQTCTLAKASQMDGPDWQKLFSHQIFFWEQIVFFIFLFAAMDESMGLFGGLSTTYSILLSVKREGGSGAEKGRGSSLSKIQCQDGSPKENYSLTYILFTPFIIIVIYNSPIIIKQKSCSYFPLLDQSFWNNYQQTDLQAPTNQYLPRSINHK